MNLRSKTSGTAAQTVLHSAALFVAFCVSFSSAAIGAAGETARDYVQPYVTRVQYQELLESIDLDRDQQFIATAIYSDYANMIDDAVDAANQLAVDAGRDTVDAVLSGRVRMTADELRSLRVNVLKAHTTVWPTVDAALYDLLEGTQAILNSVQAQQADPVLLGLRRDLYLEPARMQQYSSEYAGEGVCLLDLVAEARTDGGELAGVDNRQLQQLLRTYEMQLDQVLPDVAAKLRQASVDRRLASIDRDDRAERAADARLLQPWQQLYDLNRRTAQAIAGLAADPADSQALMDRFHTACFPWLLDDALADRQYDWLSKQSLADPASSQIEQAYTLYRKQRRVLAESMIELIVDARLTLAVPMHPMMDPTDVPDDAAEVYEQMIRITGEQKAARSQVRDAFNAALTTAQRKAMNRAVR